MLVRATRWMLVSLLLVSMCAAQQRTQSGITGIAHFALRVNNLEAERAFLHRLGWEEPFTLAAGDSSTEAFFKVNDRQFIEIYSRGNATQETGWLHLCFASDALIALQKRYAERGLQSSSVVKGGAGNLLFSMHDPDGRVVEFTQYMPGSRHSLDYGHHLGPDRISGQLVGIRVPARDPAAALKFYSDDLGLHTGEGQKREMAYTDQGEWIAISTDASFTRAQFVFSVSSLSETKRMLAQHGVVFRQQNDSAVVTDPDGNAFVFTQSR